MQGEVEELEQIPFRVRKYKNGLSIKPADQNKRSEYVLLPDQIRKLFYAASNPRDRCIVKLLAFTGMRRDELRNLDVRDIDFESKVIHIRIAKFGKKRSVDVAEEVLSDLRFYLGDRQMGYVFASQKSDRLSSPQINNIIAKLGEKAEIKNPNPRLKHINPHIFRHSFARNALAAGVKPRIVQQLLGHESIKTTLDIYGTPSRDDVKTEYESKLAKMY